MFGRPSLPHMLQSPTSLPLHPRDINFPSKLRINSSPHLDASSAMFRLCSMNPTPISNG